MTDTFLSSMGTDVAISKNKPLPSTGGFVYASDDVLLPIDSLAKTYGQSAGQITTITVSYGGSTYVQTLTYNNGLIATESAWVKQ